MDPTHDFGKNTHHTLEVTRRLDEMVETGWPVLVSLSNKDFVGETLDRPVDEHHRAGDAGRPLIGGVSPSRRRPTSPRRPRPGCGPRAGG